MGFGVFKSTAQSSERTGRDIEVLDRDNVSTRVVLRLSKKTVARMEMWGNRRNDYVEKAILQFLQRFEKFLAEDSF
jgi:hypothetical protein